MSEAVGNTPGSGRGGGRDTGADAAAHPPTTTVGGEASPEWLDAVTELLGRDPDTGLVDTDRVLEAVGWLARSVFSHAKTDRSHHDKAGLLEQIRSTQAVMNSINAVQHVRVAQYAATADGVEPGFEPAADHDLDSVTGTDECTGPDGIREHTHPLGHVCEFADVDLAPVMRWGPMQAVRRIDDAVDAVAKTPRLLDEMGAGRLDTTRLAQVTGELIEAGDNTCRRVEDRLLERGITEWTSRQALNRTRTLVRRLDPAAAKQTRKKRAKDQIGSFTRPGPEHGLTEWNLILPTEQALPAVQAVEDLARQLHQDTNTDKTLGQCRIDAFCDLILGNAEVQTTLSVLVPIKTTAAATNTTTTNSTAAGTNGDSGSVTDSWVETMITDYNWDAALQHLVVDLNVTESATTSSGAGTGDTATPDTDPSDDHDPPEAPTDDPALSLTGLCLPDVEVPGLGVIPADAVQDMLRTLGTRLTRSLVDWRTGTLIETSCDTYRPTATIRRHVLQRDAHCRFPGCERPARFCDVDHVTPWPHGATEVGNLQCLCRHHHRAKHETRWTVTMTPDGTCTWTSPSGREYITHPGSLEVTADLHVTPGAPDTPDDGDFLGPA